MKSKRRNRPPKAPAPPSKGERLQKVLAAAGVASRRACEELIRDGRVKVNRRIVDTLGSRVDPRRDRIQLDGHPIGRPRRARHYLVYKPRGVVTTTRDPQARKTVVDLVPTAERLFPVGRLDSPSEGLLLLTNDGELAQILTHPSFAIPRTYRVSVEGRVRAGSLRRIQQGRALPGERCAPCEVRVLESAADRTLLELTLSEGRRRQIRRTLEALGHSVRRLVRVRFGPLSLRGLRVGNWRTLRKAEVQALERLIDDAPRARRQAGKNHSKSPT